MTSCLLSLKNISYHINGKPILKNISFEVQRGEVVAIIGQNGSRKSTLLGITLDDFKATDGIIDYFNCKENIFSNLGVVYENQTLFPFLKVDEIIRYFSSIYKLKKEEVAPYLELFGLLPIQNQIINSLSQGEKMKLFILLAIIHKPILLVMDEPFANIDPTIITTIMRCIRSTCETVLFSTNDWNLAQVSDKIALLYNGFLICPILSAREYIDLLPLKRKWVLPNTSVMRELVASAEFFEHDNQLTVFSNDQGLLNKITSATNNYSLLDADIKDVYLYLISTKANQSKPIQ